MLGLQPREDPLGRVPLFPVDLLVAFENLVDDRQELPDLRPLARPFLLVLWWFRVLEALAIRQIAGPTLR